MGKTENGFVFQPSYYETAQSIPKKDRLEFYEALIRFGCYGEEPDFTGFGKTAAILAGACFITIRATIDAGKRRYAAAVENGKKGGRPSGKSGSKKPSENQFKNQNENQNQNQNGNQFENQKQNLNKNKNDNENTNIPHYHSDSSTASPDGEQIAAGDLSPVMTVAEGLAEIRRKEQERLTREWEEQEARRQELLDRIAKREAAHDDKA